MPKFVTLCTLKYAGAWIDPGTEVDLDLAAAEITKLQAQGAIVTPAEFAGLSDGPPPNGRLSEANRTNLELARSRGVCAQAEADEVAERTGAVRAATEKAERFARAGAA